MFEYSGYRFILACGATDMRKSINGLSEIVLGHFRLDPREKIIFGFCNRMRNRVKLLVWEDNGFWIHFKRIEKGRVSWPEPDGESDAMTVTAEDIRTILASPGVVQKLKRSEAWKTE